MTSYQASQRYTRKTRDRGPRSGVGYMILAVFLGIAVAILAVIGVALVKTADDARDEAAIAAGTTDHSAHADSNVSLPLQSFAGQTGENAEELAMAHAATDATLPAAPVGDLVKVHMTLKDMVVEIAPGVKYNTWAFDGHGAPGPVIHVREGQTVEMTLTNGGAIPHSIDFHAARIAPERRFQGRRAGRVDHVSVHGLRPGRLHVPLRHEAGARAHRERDVRRDRRPAEAPHSRPSTTSTSSSAASGT